MNTASALLKNTHQFEEALLELDRLAAHKLLVEGLAAGSAIQRIEEMVVPAMERIGKSWEEGRIALSQVYMSGRICEELVEQLLAEGHTPRKSQPNMALAVLDDYHLLGKRMVHAALRASGFALKDYGRMDVAALVRRVQEDRIEVLLISTLMLPSALRVAQVREALDREGCRVKIIVGGAPFRLDEQLWREVGADAMGRHASEAARLVEQLAEGRP